MADDLMKALKLADDAKPQHVAAVYGSLAFLLARII